MANVAFEVKNLTKQFIGTLALDDFSLQLREKEVHAIVGENGAGKSTLCKLMTGNHQPTSGELFLKGEKVEFRSVRDSLARGVCMLYQERNMVPSFTGFQNICLGGEPHKGIFLDEKTAKEKAYALQEKLGVNLPLDVPIGTLGAGTQQMIEILRAFYHEPVFMILDEPTASLGEGEVESLLEFVAYARDTLNLPIIYITHKLEEVFQIADCITVLTDGKKTLSKRTAETNMGEVISAMLRTKEVAHLDVDYQDVQKKEPVLKVGNCTYDGHDHKLDFELRNGEVIGFYGLVGSGRTECAEMIFGLRRAEKTDIVYKGKQYAPRDISPAKMIRDGLILTPESRGSGVFYDQTIEDNVDILFLNKKYTASPFEFVRKKALHEFSKELLAKHNVKMSDMQQGIVELSGGNMQKVIIGRSIEIDHNEVLILDEPTNGIDIGAKNEIYRKIRTLVEKQNRAILFISSEIEELLTVCDRLYVFSEGDIVGEFSKDEFDKMGILEIALGRKTT